MWNGRDRANNVGRWRACVAACDFILGTYCSLFLLSHFSTFEIVQATGRWLA
jgi:hypothetical protein